MLRHHWVGRSGREWRLDGRRDLIMTSAGLRGLRLPEIEHFRRARMDHGSRWAGWRVTERDVAWPISTHGGADNDPLAWLEQDRDFWSDLHPGYEGTWTVTAIDGTTRTLNCRVRGDGGLAITRDPLRFGRLAYVVELDGDPFWLGDPVERAWGVTGYQGPWLIAPGSGGGGVFRFAVGQTMATASVTNPGDVEAWPTWTIHGPASSWSVGVGNQQINSTVTLADGEIRTVVTDGGGVYVTNAAGTDKFTDLTAARATAIEAGQSVKLSINLVGNGGIEVSFRPRYLQAY